VNVNIVYEGQTKLISFYRTKDACEQSKAARDKQTADSAHKLDDYR
jgi:hypothetical protein